MTCPVFIFLYSNGGTVFRPPFECRTKFSLVFKWHLKYQTTIVFRSPLFVANHKCSQTIEQNKNAVWKFTPKIIRLKQEKLALYEQESGIQSILNEEKQMRLKNELSKLCQIIISMQGKPVMIMLVARWYDKPHMKFIPTHMSVSFSSFDCLSVFLSLGLCSIKSANTHTYTYASLSNVEKKTLKTL